MYPNASYDNLNLQTTFFEKKSDNPHIEINSFQTQLNPPLKGGLHNEPESIKRTRSGLINKVMDSEDVKGTQDGEKGLIKKCPGNHKLKLYNTKPGFYSTGGVVCDFCDSQIQESNGFYRCSGLCN